MPWYDRSREVISLIWRSVMCAQVTAPLAVTIAHVPSDTRRGLREDLSARARDPSQANAHHN